MKKMFKGILIIFLMFIGIMGVRAEEKYLSFSDNEQLNRICDTSKQYHEIFLESNFDSNSGDKIFYRIDDGEYKESENLNYIEISTNLLKDKAEHTVTVYGELSDGTETDKISIDILSIGTVKVNNEVYKLNLTLEDFPINTKMTVSEVKDDKIISKIKLYDPNVIKVRFESNGKELGYYEDKYSKFLSNGFCLINGTIDISWTNKKSISYDAQGKPYNDINVYGIDGKYNILSTNYDNIDDTQKLDNIFDLDYMIYSSDIFINGYIAISNGDSHMILGDSNEVVQTTQKQEKNPKTNDMNNNLVLAILIGSISLAAIAKKRIKKLSK